MNLQTAAAASLAHPTSSRAGRRSTPSLRARPSAPQPRRCVGVNSSRVAVTSDSNVLDGVARWLNLGRMIVERHVPEAWVIDLGDEGRENLKFEI